jgi:16S rRNA (guanine1207-N2)-methyltransferase
MTTDVLTSAPGVYGAPPPELAATPAGAAQYSPLIPGSAALEDVAAGSLPAMTMLAPPGVLERRYALALALRALKPRGRLTVMAPKDKGGSRLHQELEAFGASAPRFVEALGLWSQPGVFSWDRPDPGSALLAQSLPALSGDGADLGCGIGHLALQVLAAPKVKSLILIDSDRRAVEAARRNVADPRAQIRWADVRSGSGIEGLDFVVMNPPFHDGGREDKALGLTFVRVAQQALRKSGVLWVVANRHLPYEAALAEGFKTFTQRVDKGGFKVFEARK